FAINDQYYVLEATRYSEQIDADIFKSKKSLLRSDMQYRNIMKEQVYGNWGIDNLKVLFVFDSIERMKNTIALVEGLEHEPYSFVFYAFETLNVERSGAKCPVPLTNILTVHGLRVGHARWVLETPNPKEVSIGHTATESAARPA